MKTPFFVLILLILCHLTEPGLAQKGKKKLKSAGTIQLNDSLTSFGQSDIFAFPNVNVTSFYYDAKILKQLADLKRSGPKQEYYQALRTYVSNFGIRNFHENTAMMWELARLSVSQGHPGEAILLYKLVLKHHRQGLDTADVFREYDSLERDKKKYYVPLEHYYQLVAYRKEVDTLRPPHAVLINMGDNVNSLKEDYAPTIGNVDSLMLFTSKRNKNNIDTRQYDEDIFYSERVDGYWGPAKSFDKINTIYNEGSACMSLDGKLMIFSRCFDNNCDLFSAERPAIDSAWRNVHNLGPNINSGGWDSHPSLSHSSDTLFFASNRLNSFGLSDIFFAVRVNGVWGKAQNAGPVINTANSEVSPFFHHRYNMLYFSSNGQALNFGDFDIYKSAKLQHSWGEPKNVGPLVNGAGSEYYFTIDSKSKELFYARSEAEDRKNLDLFSFPVPMEAKPEATAQLKGSLKDQAGLPMKGIVSVIDLDEGVEVAPKYLREDGTFDFSLINRRNYLLVIQGDDYFRMEQVFFLDGEIEINKIAEPIESKIAFASLEFENGKANILPVMHTDLDKLANFLIDHPQLQLTISGHTDSAGKEESNLRLSQARADAIKQYLVSGFSIDATRIKAIGYGSSKPATQELSDEHKQLNRRVEFEISRSH